MSLLAPSYLFYQLIRADEKWCYKLTSPNDELPAEIKEGVSFNGSGIELLQYTPALVAYLCTSLQTLNERSELRPLCLSFRDELFLRQPDKDYLYQAVVDIRTDRSQGLDWAVYILFSSLYLCFSTATESTFIVRIFAAWQRYNLIKMLYKKWLEKDESRAKWNILDDVLDNEFSSSYRALSDLILDEANSYACRILWKEGWRQHGGKYDGYKEIPDPQIRQRLRRSMFLEIHSNSDALYEAPLLAPGCFENDAQVSWFTNFLRWLKSLLACGIELHPRFRNRLKGKPNRTGQAAVRRFVYQELLPQYNLKAALRLIRLMRYGYRAKAIRLIGWGIGILIPLIICSAFIISLASVIGCSFDCAWFGYYLDGALVGLPIAALLLLLCGLLLWQDSITLLLPRITGGIAIGYFPLLMASDPWRLAVYGSQNHRIWFIEWLSILLITLAYLYREAHPFILTFWETLRRSFKVLAWATVQAMLLGFLLILLATPIYQQATYNYREMGFTSEADVQRHLQRPCAALMTTSGKDEISVAKGLDYCVDIRYPRMKFPVSALLTFAPIALLLGIILQILWEEKPVTASVWPSESR